MPTFEYDSVLTTGGASSGTIEAMDRGEAIRVLRRRGEVATRLSPLGGKGRVAVPRRTHPGRSGHDHSSGTGTGGGASSLFSRRSMSRSDFTSFIREIATALEAGLPLMAALRAMAKQAVNDRQQAVMDHLIDRIEAGRSFAQAAAEWGNPFDDMALGMLRAGEASGQLDRVMLQLAELLDRDGALRRAVRGAMMYPIVLLVLLFIGVTVIVTFTIPKILSVVGDQGMILPWPTRVVQGAADFTTSYWWVIIGGIGAIVFFYRWMLTQPQMLLTYHSILLRTPVLGTLLRDVSVGRFTRTMGTMLGSGVPVLDALTVTRDTLGNKAMEAVIDDVAEQVRGGKSIADPMERSGRFPPLLIQVVSLGERSGRLDTMLLHASDSFDKRTQETIKTFTTLLPVGVLLLMAGVILFVLAAAMLPLVEMQSIIG